MAWNIEANKVKVHRHLNAQSVDNLEAELEDVLKHLGATEPPALILDIEITPYGAGFMAVIFYR